MTAVTLDAVATVPDCNTARERAHRESDGSHGATTMAMDYASLIDQVLHTINVAAHQTPASDLPPHEREAAGRVQQMLHEAPGPDGARKLAHQLFDTGLISKAMLLSLLCLIAYNPQVRDYTTAARLADELEAEAQSLTEPERSLRQAAVHRHRGSIAAFQDRVREALEEDTKALECWHSAQNLANVLSDLVRLGARREASELLEQIRTEDRADLVAELNTMVREDPDLALLRTTVN